MMFPYIFWKRQFQKILLGEQRLFGEKMKNELIAVGDLVVPYDLCLPLTAINQDNLGHWNSYVANAGECLLVVGLCYLHFASYEFLYASGLEPEAAVRYQPIFFKNGKLWKTIGIFKKERLETRFKIISRLENHGKESCIN